MGAGRPRRIVRLEQDLDVVCGCVLRDAAQHLRGWRQRLADRNSVWKGSPEDTHRRCPEGEREIYHKLALPHALGAASFVILNEQAGGVKCWHTQPTRSGGLNYAL